jgi:hypothetical protein
MPNVILAVVAFPDVAARVPAAAGGLGAFTGAVRINALAIRVPPIETVMPTEEIVSEKTEQRIRTEERQRPDQLKSMFEAWAVGMPADIPGGAVRDGSAGADGTGPDAAEGAGGVRPLRRHRLAR